MRSGWSGYRGLVRRRNGRFEPRVDVAADPLLAIVVGEARIDGGVGEPGQVFVGERPRLARAAAKTWVGRAPNIGGSPLCSVPGTPASRRRMSGTSSIRS